MVPPTPRLRASDIMEPNLTYVYPHTRVQSLVSILRTTVHHAFPVVTENRGNEKEFMKGNQLISNNIKFKVEPWPEWELVTPPCMPPPPEGMGTLEFVWQEEGQGRGREGG